MHCFLPEVLELPAAANRVVVATGNLTRDVNSGHECHMFRVDELRSLLLIAGLADVELHTLGWLTTGKENIPEAGSDEWRLLFEAELEASRESPGAGTHIIALGRVL